MGLVISSQKRIYDREFCPLDYGADGHNNADDTVALNKTFDEAWDSGTTAPRGSVYLPNGYIFRTSGLTFSGRDGMRIHGGGKLYLADGSDACVIQTTNCDHWRFEDIEIDGNAGNQGAGSWHGLEIIEGAYDQLLGVNIHHCLGDGLNIATNGNGMADEIQIIGGRYESNWLNGISILYCGDLTLVGAHLDFNMHHGFYGYAPYSIAINGGQALSNGWSGYVLEGVGPTYYFADRCVINGVMSRANGTHGVWLINARQCTVSNSVLHYNSQGTPDTSSGIKADNCLSLSITGCQALNSILLASQKYGIQLTGTTNNTTIVSNVLTPNMTSPAVLVGTYYAFGNIGLTDNFSTNVLLGNVGINGSIEAGYYLTVRGAAYIESLYLETALGIDKGGTGAVTDILARAALGVPAALSQGAKTVTVALPGATSDGSIDLTMNVDGTVAWANYIAPV